MTDRRCRSEYLGFRDVTREAFSSGARSPLRRAVSPLSTLPLTRSSYHNPRNTILLETRERTDDIVDSLRRVERPEMSVVR